MLHDISLFIGVETFYWTLADFDRAAQFARVHGVDVLIVKVFDGPNEWYGSIGGYDAVANTILNRGVQVLPYGYMYGNAKGSSLDTELNMVEKYMNTYGWFMADIETEWDGHTDWATTLNDRLSSNLNVFIVSCLADPQPEQNSGAVFKIMAPSVNAWAPQVYDAFLDQVYSSEFGQIASSLCIMPSVSFGTLPGNDPLAFVKAFPNTPISIWELQPAEGASVVLLDQIVSLVKNRSTMPKLTPTGEVMSLNEANQFQPGKTQDACGFFACAIVRSGSPPGQPPQRSVQTVIDDAEMWYAQFDGDNSISNTDGMSLAQLYALIKQMTYDYRAIDLGNSPLAYIEAWVKQGYPVIVALGESSVFDLDLGGSPYYWNTTPFNHIITVTGISPDGHFLCRDSASVTDLFNPNSLRPGPRRYDQNRFSLVSATAVVMPWLPKPPAGFDPTKETISMLPVGWTDVVVNGDPQLHNPKNSFVVRGGFRQFILNNPWDAWNVPLENEQTVTVIAQSNPPFGGGASQLFENAWLVMAANQGNKIGLGHMGGELVWARTNLANTQASLDAANKQIADLQAQLAACNQPPPPVVQVPDDLQSAINTAASLVPVIQKYAK